MHGPTPLPEYQLIAELLGFGTGVVMSVLFMQLAARLGRPPSALAWLVASSLLWNVFGLATMVLILCGFGHLSAPVYAMHSLNMAGGAIFPISFLILWSQAEPRSSLQRSASQWLPRIARFNAAWIIALLFLCPLVADRRVMLAGMYATPINASLLLTAGALLLLQGRLKHFAERLNIALTLTGVWGSTISILLLDRFDPPASLSAFLVVTKEQAPFLAVLGSLFLFARFRWAGVLIKTALRVVAAVWIAFATYLAIRYALPGWTAGSSFPSAALISSSAGLIAAGLLVFPYLDRWMMSLVDRRILRRPDYREALREVWKEIGELGSEGDVAAHVEQRTTSMLDIAAVRIVSRDALGPADLEDADDTDSVWEFSCDDPRCTALGGPHLEAAIPIRTRGAVTHLLAVSPGSCGRSLLAEDMEFLSRVAGLVGARMDAIASERERVERQNREAQLQRLAAEAELKALRAQINPHFLFNSLNTIADLIVTDPEKAETMTVLLGKLFRRLLTHSDRQVTPLADEMDFLRTYLRIEEVRFGARLRVRMDIDSAVSRETVPSLILQPVVENAIKHGLAPKTGPGQLTISANREGAFVKLAVEDDGDGTLASPVSRRSEGNGVGLKIVAERLKTLYDGKASLDVEMTPDSGSRVTILIPCGEEIT